MISFYDVRVVEGKNTRVVLDNGDLDEISESFFQGAAIRALSGGAWGFVCTDRLDDLDEKLEIAKGIAKKIDEGEELDLAYSEPGRGVGLPVKKDPQDLSLEEKVELLKDIETAAKVVESPAPRRPTTRQPLPLGIRVLTVGIWSTSLPGWVFSSPRWPSKTASTRLAWRAGPASVAWSFSMM